MEKQIKKIYTMSSGKKVLFDNAKESKSMGTLRCRNLNTLG